MPFISVIIPAYNKGPHISRCINSVLKQTYSNYELIIVYEKSADETLQEINNFKDKRIKVFFREEPGPGGYAARNLGIEKASAEWIAFLDADDEWYPDHLENLLVVISQNPQAGIIGAGFKAIDDKRETIQPYYTRSRLRGVHTITFTDFIKIYLDKQRFGNTSVVACPKKVLNEIGGFPAGKTKKGGDLYTWIKIFAKYNGVWSAHLGANIYHNAVNKVTSNSYFNIPFLKGVCEEVDLSSDDMKLLKKYINSLIFKDYIRYILNQNRRGFLLRTNVFYLDPMKYLMYNILDIIPFFVLHRLVKLRLSSSSEKKI